MIALDWSTSNYLPASLESGLSAEAQRLGQILEDVRRALLAGTSLGAARLAIRTNLDEVYQTTSADNWDGYGAKAVDVAVYQNALSFLDSVPITVPAPEIVAEPDGELAFEWYRGPQRVFSVSVSSDGRLTYAGLFDRRSKVQGTEPLSSVLPRAIASSVRRVLRGDRDRDAQ